MSELQEITVIVAADGTVSVVVDGVRGSACEGLTAALEQALGGAVLSREHKESYYDAEVGQIDQESLRRGG